MNTQSPGTFERYLALDTLRDKHYVVVGGVNAQQHVILPPRRLDLGEWTLWLPKHLRPTDALVLEATTNTWIFYDQIAPRVGRCIGARQNRQSGCAASCACARGEPDSRSLGPATGSARIPRPPRASATARQEPVLSEAEGCGR